MIINSYPLFMLEKQGGKMETLKNIMAFVGFCATIISLIIVLINLRKNFRSISWRKVKKGAHQLIKKVEEVNPDLIITFSGRGAIFANLIITELDNKYPVYTCLLNNKSNDIFLRPLNWNEFETQKWLVYVPDEILNFKHNKILIIDDITRSGETIEKLTAFLTQLGGSTKNIFSMSLMANEDILVRSRIPQYYWKIINTIEFRMPWESK